ncbi:EthD domain-containing protein [Gordonia humi]|uniref:Uncharacterized protein (TIGR02118 family) n=1 Tax=Gordonia humi TaxID=686429 RepID=A0A840EP81_9ACTN|nr:EthD domain-containing protein [Gordonia humi]MBB4133512.1 uncharacterized protein (TIGR02118 family) [Gordonia humi]
MSVRLTFCLTRLPHLSRTEFLDYWYDVHAPLVRERAELLGIIGYEQSHTVDGDPAAPLAAHRGAPGAVYDGVASLWFESLDAFRSGGRTREERVAAAELVEDEKNFIDLSKSPLWMTRDRIVVARDGLCDE